MALRNWHVGKLVILWVWGSVFASLFLKGMNALDDNSNFGIFLGLLFVVFIAGIYIVLSIITWKWLGGRENTGD